MSVVRAGPPTMPRTRRSVTARFPAQPAAVRDTREFVRRCLEDPLLVDDALLLVSELASNAIEHARSSYEVRVEHKQATVRVAVRDRCRRPAHVIRAPVDAPRGRGLRIVASLASRWGVERKPLRGKAVWFELDVPARAVPR